MEAALAVSEPAVWATVPMMLAQAALHLLHGAGERADLVGGMDVEFGAGEISGGDGVGAAGDQSRLLRVMRRARRNETMPPMSAPKMVAVHRVRRTAMFELLQGGHLGIALVLLGLNEGPHGGEQGRVQGENLRVQEIAGLA